MKQYFMYKVEETWEYGKGTCEGHQKRKQRIGFGSHRTDKKHPFFADNIHLFHQAKKGTGLDLLGQL